MYIHVGSGVLLFIAFSIYDRGIRCTSMYIHVPSASL